MKNTHITQPQFAMIWFGAALSIAEIMTGTYLAPLGLTQGLYAIILGHIIGGILLFGAGLIGGRLRQGSMNTTAFSFGPLGAKGFACFKYAPTHRLDQHHDLRCHVSLTSTGTSITYDLDHCHRSPRHFVALHRPP